MRVFYFCRIRQKQETTVKSEYNGDKNTTFLLVMEYTATQN